MLWPITSAARRPGQSPRARILLAEDIAEVRGYMVDSLAGMGYAVHVAADGVDAVILARRTRPDIALLNNLMPRMTGIAACARLSAMACLDGLPIVVFSTCCIDQFRQPALAAGAWACWQMPLSLGVFSLRTAVVLAGGGRDPESPRGRFRTP